MTEAAKHPGRQIGKYIVKRELGRGAMGPVYLAEQPGQGREVAIKQLIVNQDGDPSALPRFLQEAQLMARSTHQNIVQVRDLEQAGNANYIVVEYVRGESLRARMKSEQLPAAQVFAVMHALLQALDYAHRHNVVHRDVRPENVLLSEAGEVKVSDFGIVRLSDDAHSSTVAKTATAAGTPQYLSPEQVAGSKVDGRSDLYSAGVVLYELVCGRPPFDAGDTDGPFSVMAKHVSAAPPPPTLFRPDIDVDLDALILKALAKRPEDRYQTAEEFDRALTRVADRLAPGWERSLHAGNQPEPSARPSTKARAGCLAALSLFLAVAILVVAALAR
jgi:serine/threonine protein kinase